MLKNKMEAERMGQNARKFALQNFDINKVVEQNENLYNRIKNT